MQQYFTLEVMLSDLIQIVGETQNTLHISLTVDCISLIITRQGLNDARASTILSYLLKVNGSKLELSSPHYKGVTDQALDFIERNKQISPPELFDSELLFIVVRMLGYKHSAVKSITDKVAKFAQNIVSMQITLKDINSNFNNKRKYIEQMVTLVDPNADFTKIKQELI